jgi:hypothetical protein
MGTDPLFLPTVNDLVGKVSIGVSHKAGQLASTGSGVVTRVVFTSLATTPDNTPVLFSLSNVSANDPNGGVITLTPSTLLVMLINPGIPVWPGDTNNDGVVNQADVLPLGLYWGRTGPIRPGASVSWTRQLCPPWTPQNATYADATGDGNVNQADVLPIGINWGRTHTSIPAGPLRKEYSSFSAVLEPKINSAPMPGEEFFIQMKLVEGTNLFGLACELSYDRPEALQVLTVEPDASFGADALFYSKVNQASGKIAVGISRKAGQEVSLIAGSVVRIKAKLSVNARLGETITFSLQEAVANDSNGRLIEVHSQISRMTIGVKTKGEAENKPQLITDYRLYQNSPNPFNPSTVIRYEIPEAVTVMVKVFNTNGQEVRTLVNGLQPAGAHQISWDGRDAKGESVPSGLYLYRLQTGTHVETRRMLLVR